MLPSVYQSLKSKARRDTFVFVAFAGEEGGLLGSHAYIKQLSAEERRLIHAMVNLECLGASPPKYGRPARISAYWLSIRT